MMNRYPSEQAGSLRREPAAEQGDRPAETRLDALGRVGRALADPARCRLLLALIDGPAYSADLAERAGLSRSNCSNHLACLRDCGIVAVTPHGRRSEYALADPRLRHALEDLVGVVLLVRSHEEA